MWHSVQRGVGHSLGHQLGRGKLLNTLDSRFRLCFDDGMTTTERVTTSYRLRDLANRWDDAGRITPEHYDRLMAATFEMVADLTIDEITAALRSAR